jgi:RNA polymerase sporulation-specific sigma factor
MTHIFPSGGDTVPKPQVGTPLNALFCPAQRLTRPFKTSGWELFSCSRGGKDVTRNKVEICGVDTSKLPVLNNKEMRELFERLQGGELAAREKLVNGNLRLVLSVIQRFNNRGEYVDDLFQVGCIGLMKAIDNFDLGQNVKFSTYAVPMIIGEIRRYLRDNNPIRVSRSLRDIAYKALQVRDQLTNKNSREPTIVEISSELNVPKEDVVFALDAIQDPVSLFEPIYQDGGDPIYVMDQISDEKNKDATWVEEIALREGMQRLGEREKMILSMRFYEGKTQMEVAEEIGISQAQVSRLEKAAIAHMQKHVQS